MTTNNELRNAGTGHETYRILMNLVFFSPDKSLIICDVYVYIYMHMGKHYAFPNPLPPDQW